MVAKLRACTDALANGVGDVLIVDGRDAGALEAAALDTPPPGATRLVPAPVTAGRPGSTITFPNTANRGVRREPAGIPQVPARWPAIESRS